MVQMGCQLRGHSDKQKSNPGLQCNWSKSAYYIMRITEEFNPKTPEYYEFEDPYSPNTPTYQNGIDGNALRQAYNLIPTNYAGLSVEEQSKLSSEEFNYARTFAKNCITANVSYISVSY